MKTLKDIRHREIGLLFVLASLGMLVVPGCGDDDNPEPSTPVITGGAAGTSGSGGRGGRAGSSGNSNNEGGNGNEAGSVDGEGGEDTGSSGGRAGRGSGGSSGRSNSGGSGATTAGTSNNEGGDGGGGEDIDCSVRGPDNCYRCDPVAIDPAPAFPHSENEQFLNHCDDSQGSKFDNFERIPGFTGTLPALP